MFRENTSHRKVDTINDFTSMDKRLQRALMESWSPLLSHSGRKTLAFRRRLQLNRGQVVSKLHSVFGGNRVGEEEIV